ncbi:shikimate dehydrogenase, partial [candidate division FCPU426 bacterium]|nr:shikimate dehydrogenase [candidate division FCPU426 bacterium]
PLGLKERDPLPLPRAWMPQGICVMDVVYSQGHTAFLRLALARGNRIVPGWRMLLHQGAKAFHLWTGCRPPLDRMEQALCAVAGLKSV